MKGMLVLSLLLGLVGCTNPTENTDKNKQLSEEQLSDTVDGTEVAYADFGLTADEFAKRYNQMIATVDENWIINVLENEGGGVRFAPMPYNASLGGVVQDDGKLSGLIMGIVRTDDMEESLHGVLIAFTMASVINPAVPQDEVQRLIANLFSASYERSGEVVVRDLGKVKYGVLYSEKDNTIYVSADPIP